jgi:hypothetical protein
MLPTQPAISIVFRGHSFIVCCALDSFSLVLQVMDVGFRYAPQLPPIFDSLNFGVDMESRICVVGKQR